ncbi:hypothetical protein [Nonomuraea jabiensis]|uniref:MFS transporter n=1 Tax=Nonomuraea jabiensis TaxID=882448 RepID=A0A7W9GD56_9ACTN|nr:hypothetical protein [Nonomuraea jabiensis]MBB5781605.1 hypothetical protein [Nonomuraea jabiensis]
MLRQAGRFLIGPVVDHRYGDYRGRLIGTQPALFALAALDPVADLPAVLAVMAAVLVVSAFHDTAVNGLPVRLLAPDERGTANGIQTAAACLSILVGSGGALLLYTWPGWAVTPAAVAAVFCVPLAVPARFTEPGPWPAGDAVPPWRSLTGVFRSRRSAAWTLLVVPLSALGLYLATAVQSAMLPAAGWGTERIAPVRYTFAPMAGAAATDVTVQVSALGVLLGAAELVLAGLAGYPLLIAASVLLSLAGTAVAVLWARRHTYSNLAPQRG